MIDIHVIIISLMGSGFGIYYYSLNSIWGYVLFGLVWCVGQLMLLFRFVFTPHRSWKDFAFNQMFPGMIIGVSLLYAHYMVLSSEISWSDLLK
jgi:Na+/proline symporter